MRTHTAPATYPGICVVCGGNVQVFVCSKRSAKYPTTPKCARCRQRGSRDRHDQAIAISVERALGARKEKRQCEP